MMLNVTSHQENSKQSYKEVTSRTCYDGNHQIGLYKREITTYLCVRDRIHDKVYIIILREGLHQLVCFAYNSRTFFLCHTTPKLLFGGKNMPFQRNFQIFQLKSVPFIRKSMFLLLSRKSSLQYSLGVEYIYTLLYIIYVPIFIQLLLPYSST